MEDTSMEDDLNGRRLNGRRAKWKTTSMEDGLNGRQPQLKTTSIQDDFNFEE